MDLTALTELLSSAIRLSTPLLFASMGGLLCEKSGVATICLEGALLVGAWGAATLTFFSHSPSMGLCFGVLLGALLFSVHGFLSVYARADAIISGLCVNLLAAGLTPLLCKTLFENTANTPSLALNERLRELSLWGLSRIPFLGELLFQQPAIVYLALILPFILAFFFRRSPLAFWIQASGDAPQALTTAGISPFRVRFWSVICGGAVAALGGVYLGIVHGSQFTRDMSAGRGYIALAALLIGKWKPLPTALACLLFGLAEAFQIRLQGAAVGGIQIPVQFVQMVPYLVTLVVLVGLVGKSRPPLSIGKSL